MDKKKSLDTEKECLTTGRRNSVRDLRCVSPSEISKDKKLFLVSSEDSLSNLKIGDGLVIENIRECVLVDNALEEKIHKDIMIDIRKGMMYSEPDFVIDKVFQKLKDTLLEKGCIENEKVNKP